MDLQYINRIAMSFLAQSDGGPYWEGDYPASKPKQKQCKKIRPSSGNRTVAVNSKDKTLSHTELLFGSRHEPRLKRRKFLNDSSAAVPLPKSDPFTRLSPPPYFRNGVLTWETEFMHPQLRAAGNLIDMERRPTRVGDENTNDLSFPPRKERHQPKILWSPESASSGRSDQDLLGIIARLSTLFENFREYRRLLECRDLTAQRLLDLLQTLLDMPQLEATFKRHLVVAVQRLSQSSGLYPTCFSLDNIQLISEFPMAAGSFGDIFKGTFQNECVCLKVIRIYQASRVDYLKKRLFREAILWGQLSHRNLLPFYGVYHFRSRLCLVAPWMENGDITSYLESHPNENRVLLARDVATGVSYLHANDIIHGDLKGANILVTDSGRACLADFGLSSVTDAQIVNWTSQSSVGSKGGSVRWQAPELFDFHEDSLIHNSKASDVYAMSCVFYELFTGSIPFVEHARDATVILKIQSGVYPSQPPDSDISRSVWGLTNAIWSLMETCWSNDPSLRPKVDEVICQLDQHLVRDDMPVEFETLTSSRARFHSSVNGCSDILDASQLENLIFETESMASELSHILSRSK